jgi:hypothetical protein
MLHHLDLDLTVPANTSATVRLPVHGDVTEGGKPLDETDGIIQQDVLASKETLKVSAGRYQFRVTR